MYGVWSLDFPSFVHLKRTQRRRFGKVTQLVHDLAGRDNDKLVHRSVVMSNVGRAICSPDEEFFVLTDEQRDVRSGVVIVEHDHSGLLFERIKRPRRLWQPVAVIAGPLLI